MKRDIIVIGSSAGGIDALRQLVQMLPAKFDGSIFIVQHFPSAYNSILDIVLSRSGPLEAVFAKDGELFEKGRIYLAPPDHHLLVENGKTLVKKGPKENKFRPSIDALFRSAAYNYGPQVIGVVLSGLLNDGTSGLWSVKRSGGIAIVQDPSEAEYDAMPQNVLQNVEVDHVAAVHQIPVLLQEIMNNPIDIMENNNKSAAEKVLLEMEVKIASNHNSFEAGMMDMGKLSPFTCPECHGVLVSIKEGKYSRYRCHTGHAFSSTALLAEITKTVEDNFWSTVRGMEEGIMLLENKGEEYALAGEKEASNHFYKKAKEMRVQSQQVRKIIFSTERLSEEKLEQDARL